MLKCGKGRKKKKKRWEDAFKEGAEVTLPAFARIPALSIGLSKVIQALGLYKAWVKACPCNCVGIHPPLPWATNDMSLHHDGLLNFRD